MPAQLLDGKVMAAELEEELKKRVEALKEKGYTPGLTVILVGDDPASQTYVSNKEKACARLGIRSRTLRMPADTTQETLEAAIREANADPSVNGILVQLPLPRRSGRRPGAFAHPARKGRGRLSRYQRGPAVARAGLRGGLHAQGRAAYAQARGHSHQRQGSRGRRPQQHRRQAHGAAAACRKTPPLPSATPARQHLAAHTRRADILVAAVGKPRFITADMVKAGAVVRGRGHQPCGWQAVRRRGLWARVAEVLLILRPVPGGVGKMTIAMLMDNTVAAAEKAAAAL